MLEGRELFRAAVSRCYFAAYAALTGVFVAERGDEFAFGGNNPGHAQLESLVRNNLPGRRFDVRLAKDTAQRFSTLRKLRATADYIPAHSIDRDNARRAVRLAEGLVGDVRRLGYA